MLHAPKRIIASIASLRQRFNGLGGRFPTNTPGWWGGAHPFSLLDWSVVHNGEISSYGTNRRYLETCGYHCSLPGKVWRPGAGEPVLASFYEEKESREKEAA